MEKKIIEILLKHSSELNIKSGIMAEPEIEDWLWSGEFEKVAHEIVKLFAISDVVGQSEQLIAFLDKVLKGRNKRKEITADELLRIYLEAINCG